MSDIGHAQMLIDRAAALRASMIARGASPDALARLPKPPRYDNSKALPPVVLATAENGTRYDLQEQIRTRRVQHVEPPRAPAAGAFDRAQGILQAVAEVSGLSVERIVGERRTSNRSLPRHMAVYVVATMSGLTHEQTAPLFHYRSHAAIYHPVQRIRRLLAQQDREAVRLHDEVRARIGCAP